jgi:hypothetical protein
VVLVVSPYKPPRFGGAFSVSPARFNRDVVVFAFLAVLAFAITCVVCVAVIPLNDTDIKVFAVRVVLIVHIYDLVEQVFDFGFAF